MTRLSTTLLATGAFALGYGAGRYGGAWAWRRYVHTGVPRRRRAAHTLRALPPGELAPYEQAARWARQAMFGS